MYEPAIFSSEQVTYGDLYAWFKVKLVAAGWENITSNYATDGDVWHSTGESGTRNYYFSTVNFNSFGGMVTKQFLGYIPGTAGSAGTFIGNPNGAVDTIFSGLAVPCGSANGNALPTSDTPIYLTYSINKERAIIALSLPEGLFTQGTGSTAYPYGKSNLWYIGAPELYSTSGEDDSQSARGLIIYGGKYYTIGGDYYYPWLQIYRSAPPETTVGSYNENPIYSLDTVPMFKIRNSTGINMLCDLIAAGPYEGVFLKLNDLFLIPQPALKGFNTGLHDGDLLTDGEYTYKIILMQLHYYRILPLNSSNVFAVRVS